MNLNRRIILALHFTDGISISKLTQLVQDDRHRVYDHVYRLRRERLIYRQRYGRYFLTRHGQKRADSLLSERAAPKLF